MSSSMSDMFDMLDAHQSGGISVDAPHVGARKADILRLAQQAVERRGQRRRTRRHALLTLVLMVGVTGLAMTLTPRAPAPPSHRPIAEAATEPASAIARVATTEGLAGAMAVSERPGVRRAATGTQGVVRLGTTPGAVDRLTDAQALALLEEVGRPAGLIRVDGRAMLVYHDHRPERPGPSGHAAPVAKSAALAALPMGRPYRPM